jgi:hypothetical protein
MPLLTLRGSSVSGMYVCMHSNEDIIQKSMYRKKSLNIRPKFYFLCHPSLMTSLF